MSIVPFPFKRGNQNWKFQKGGRPWKQFGMEEAKMGGNDFQKKVLVLDLLLSFMKLHGTVFTEILSNDMRSYEMISFGGTLSYISVLTCHWAGLENVVWLFITCFFLKKVNDSFRLS